MVHWNESLYFFFQVCLVRFVCVFNLQVIEFVGEFYVRLVLGSTAASVGIFVGLLQYSSGDVTVRSVYTIVTGKVKGKRRQVNLTKTRYC